VRDSSAKEIHLVKRLAREIEHRNAWRRYSSGWQALPAW